MATKKSPSSTKKTVATKPKARVTAVRSTVKKPKSTAKHASAARVYDKVDYYPNRMTLAVSVLGGTILVLVAVISVLGSRS